MEHEDGMSLFNVLHLANGLHFEFILYHQLIKSVFINLSRLSETISHHWYKTKSSSDKLEQEYTELQQKYTGSY